MPLLDIISECIYSATRRSFSYCAEDSSSIRMTGRRAAHVCLIDFVGGRHHSPSGSDIVRGDG